MEEVGNHNSNVSFEKIVPLCYRKPTHKDCRVLREQWIRAKYEREEFIYPDRQIYTFGHLELNMWKKGKEDERFQPRKFVLNAYEDTIKYYVKEAQKEPKTTIRISELNATFVPDKIGNPNGLQMSYVKDGSTRNIFVYTEDGKDIVNWYLAIRSAKLNRLHVAFPEANELELATKLTRDFVKEGWLSKTGPREGDTFRRRWFSLDDRKLMYMESPLAAYARGEIFLGHINDGFFVVRGSGPGSSREPGDPQGPSGCMFTLRTPTRTYLMRAETLEERTLWVSSLEKVLKKPLTPQDSSMSALLVRKRQSATSYLLSMLKTA